eukprot:1158617-Pelagomonas_calceolata.AAC.7
MHDSHCTMLLRCSWACGAHQPQQHGLGEFNMPSEDSLLLLFYDQSSCQPQKSGIKVGLVHKPRTHRLSTETMRHVLGSFLSNLGHCSRHV